MGSWVTNSWKLANMDENCRLKEPLQLVDHFFPGLFKFCLRAEVLSMADGWLRAFSSSKYASFWIAYVF